MRDWESTFDEVELLDLDIGIPREEGPDVGPAEDDLMRGEKISNITAVVQSRRGRTQVLIRIIGEVMLGWIEAAEGWGGCIEAIVRGS